MDGDLLGLGLKKVSGTLQQVDDPLPDRNPKVPDTFLGQATYWRQILMEGDWSS
jgi:hypothetical protein